MQTWTHQQVCGARLSVIRPPGPGSTVLPAPSSSRAVPGTAPSSHGPPSVSPVCCKDTCHWVGDHPGNPGRSAHPKCWGDQIPLQTRDPGAGEQQKKVCPWVPPHRAPSHAHPLLAHVGPWAPVQDDGNAQLWPDCDRCPGQTHTGRGTKDAPCRPPGQPPRDSTVTWGRAHGSLLLLSLPVPGSRSPRSPTGSHPTVTQTDPE